MLVHSVYFWLKPELTPHEVQQFQTSLQALLSITPIRQGWIGQPASTRRPVIDHTYSFALTVLFDDVAGHDAYQVEPRHVQFVEENKHRWSKVVIYDSV